MFMIYKAHVNSSMDGLFFFQMETPAHTCMLISIYVVYSLTIKIRI